MNLFNDEDAWLFAEGTHTRLFEKLGARPVAGGVRFAIWAPDASYVSVIGTFNDWEPGRNPLEFHVPTGIWCGIVPNAAKGDWYKYRIDAWDHPDPLAFATEPPPGTASVVHDLSFSWSAEPPPPFDYAEVPCAIAPDKRYRELVTELPVEANQMGFRQVALTHPGSTLAPPCRLGSPDQLSDLIDNLHRFGIAASLRVPELGSEAATGQLRSIHLSRSRFWKEVYRFSSVVPLEPTDLDTAMGAQLRLRLGQLYCSPGRKLFPIPNEAHMLIGSLNYLIGTQPALLTGQVELIHDDSFQGVTAFLRRIDGEEDTLLVVFNTSGEVRQNYRIGVPRRGFWRELLNTEAADFGGSGHGNFGGVDASPVPLHGRLHSVTLTLPPLGLLVLRSE